MVTRPNPHDAFFRQAFGSPKHVVGLLKLVLYPLDEPTWSRPPSRWRLRACTTTRVQFGRLCFSAGRWGKWAGTSRGPYSAAS